MGFLSKVWKGLKKAVGVVASIVAPFVAAPIAAAFGVSSTLGTALIGAGIGAAGSALAGGNPLVGAAIGGFGAYAANGGFNNMFGGIGGGGGTVAGQAGPAVSGATTGMTTGTPIYAQGMTTAQMMPPTGAAAGGGGVLGGVGGAFKSALGSMLDPQALARITLAAVSGQQDGLSSEERALVSRRKRELEEMAATNRAMFQQQLDHARDLLQQGEANPEQAFAQTSMTTQRQLQDAYRSAGLSERAGLRDSAQRRAAIEGTRLGTGAVAQENVRAAQTRQAGLQALPQSVPEGYAGMALPLYQGLSERARQADADFRYSVTSAMPGLFGNIT